MRRTITCEVLAAYRPHSFTLSRRRILTLGFAERMAMEIMRLHVHPLTWRTYTECLTRWQCWDRRRAENAQQRRERARFFKSVSK